MPKVISQYRICCTCGSNQTFIKKSGGAQWHGHKCKKEDCSGYVCHNCYNNINRLMTAKIKESRKGSFFEGRRCHKCGSDETYISNSNTPRWFRYIDNNGNWDRRSYLCNHCHSKKYYDEEIGPISDFRNKNLDPLSPPGKGFIGQQIIAKSYNVEDCNLKMDNFHFYVDLSKISEYGYSEVKTASLIAKDWHFGKLNKACDTIFFVCMDNNRIWKNVKRIYIAPNKEIQWNDVHIYENIGKLRRSVYGRLEKYRVIETFFNKIYHDMKIENCKILRYYN